MTPPGSGALVLDPGCGLAFQKLEPEGHEANEGQEELLVALRPVCPGLEPLCNGLPEALGQGHELNN